MVLETEARPFAALLPGAYSVTFSLPGFNQVLRDGIELAAGFTANVNEELGVGGIEETITVTGAAPVVDIQNVRRQSSIDTEALATLPLGMKHVSNLITVTPGFSGLADVGGRYSQPGDFHGKSGTKVAFDGMGIENSSGNSSYQINSLSVQEFVAQTSGNQADTNAAGVQARERRSRTRRSACSTRGSAWVARSSKTDCGISWPSEAGASRVLLPVLTGTRVLRQGRRRPDSQSICRRWTRNMQVGTPTRNQCDRL